MNMGVCGCVTGPPPGGICNACGAWGVGYRPPFVPATPYPTPEIRPGQVYFVPALPPPSLTAEDVRKIVREELERHAQQHSEGRSDG